MKKVINNNLPTCVQQCIILSLYLSPHKLKEEEKKRGNAVQKLADCDSY